MKRRVMPLTNIPNEHFKMYPPRMYSIVALIELGDSNSIRNFLIRKTLEHIRKRLLFSFSCCAGLGAHMSQHAITAPVRPVDRVGGVRAANLRIRADRP